MYDMIYLRALFLGLWAVKRSAWAIWIFKNAYISRNIVFRKKCSVLMFLEIEFSARLKKEK